MKSSRVRSVNSTRIGNRPCNSGIRSLGLRVEGPRGDQEYVIALHIAVAGLHRRTFDDRQQVALHALPRDVGPMPQLSGHDLSISSKEDDVQGLRQVDRRGVDLFGVDQGVGLLLEDHSPGFLDSEFRREVFLGKIFSNMPSRSTSIFSMPMPVNIIGTAFCSIGHLDAAVVHRASGQHASQSLPRPLVPLGRLAPWGVVSNERRGGQHSQEPVFGPALGLLADVFLLPCSHRPMAFDQFADHALHVAAVVADLRVAVASTLMNGAPVSLARRRAISVLPAPVGPIIMMFFGATPAPFPPAIAAAASDCDGNGHSPLG